MNLHRASWGLALGLALGFLDEKEPAKAPDPAALQRELDLVKSQLADQSHVMEDVSRHFSNLWFAGQKKNWPLATFFLDETRSHLRWAVRVKPIRKNSLGQDINLGSILEGIENTFFAEIKKAIEEKDDHRFATSYRRTLEGCYSCHKASEKPFLRPQMPEAPGAPMLNFDPEAGWPQ
jgi:hypothetical protein